MSEKFDKSVDDLAIALKELFNAKSEKEKSDQNIKFVADKGSTNYGKGLLWLGQGSTRQFIFSKDDKFLSTESIDLSQNRNYMIEGIPVLSKTDLGQSVVKSNLRELGVLKSLIVTGNVTIDHFFHYDKDKKSIGIGTDDPKSTLSVFSQGKEIVLGTSEEVMAQVGTYSNDDFSIVSGNVPRIILESSGTIKLGNKNFGAGEVKVHGKLSVNVNTPDSRVDMHIAGPIKFHNRLHQYLPTIPQHGNYSRGDIIWNSEPDLGKCVGWVCVREGNPGSWLSFGEIKK